MNPPTYRKQVQQFIGVVNFMSSNLSVHTYMNF